MVILVVDPTMMMRGICGEVHSEGELERVGRWDHDGADWCWLTMTDEGEIGRGDSETNRERERELEKAYRETQQEMIFWELGWGGGGVGECVKEIRPHIINLQLYHYKLVQFSFTQFHIHIPGAKMKISVQSFTLNDINTGDKTDRNQDFGAFWLSQFVAQTYSDIYLRCSWLSITISYLFVNQ